MLRLRMTGLVAASLALAAALVGCSNATSSQAPTDAQVCWRVTQFKPKLAFLSVSQGDDNLETCAMHLEYTRQTQHLGAIAGVYQGEFLFVDGHDITSSQDIEGPRFSLFTPNQRQDLEGKIQQLIQRQGSAKATAKASAGSKT